MTTTVPPQLRQRRPQTQRRTHRTRRNQVVAATVPYIRQCVVFGQEGDGRPWLRGASRRPKRGLDAADLSLDFEALRLQIVGDPAHSLSLLVRHFWIVVQITADVFQFAGVAIDSLAGAVFEHRHVRAVHSFPLEESRCICDGSNG